MCARSALRQGRRRCSAGACWSASSVDGDTGVCAWANAALLVRSQRRMGHTRLRVPAFLCANGAYAALLPHSQRRLGHTLWRVPAFPCANAALLERSQRRMGHTLLRVPAFCCANGANAALLVRS